MGLGLYAKASGPGPCCCHGRSAGSQPRCLGGGPSADSSAPPAEECQTPDGGGDTQGGPAAPPPSPTIEELPEDPEVHKPHVRIVFERALDRMSATKMLSLKAAVGNYASRLAGIATRASACSGCDIKAKVDTQLDRMFYTFFDAKLDSVHCLRSELNPKKRAFIQQMFSDATFIVGDMAGLQGDKAHDCVSGTDRMIPHFQSLDIGFPCKSRTPLSAKCRENLNCCQKDTAETGKAVNCIFKIVEKNWPEEILMECVIQLLQVGDGCEISDAAWITGQLISRGYWCIDTVVQASRQGSPVPRERIYWAAIRGIPAQKYDEASHFFLDVLHSFNVGEMSTAECNEVFLCKDPEELLHRSNVRGLPMYKGTGPMVSQAKGVKVRRGRKTSQRHSNLAPPWAPTPSKLIADAAASPS